MPIGTDTEFARLRSRHMLAGRKHPLPPHSQWKHMVPLVPAVELARGGRQRCTYVGAITSDTERARAARVAFAAGHGVMVGATGGLTVVYLPALRC